MNARSVRTAVLPPLALAICLSTSHADTFGSGTNAFTIDFVPIGNPGNLDDAGAGGGSHFSPSGGVSYEYRMGTYEISWDQVEKAFGTFPSGDLRPERGLTFYEILEFVNWLNTSTGHPPAYRVEKVFTETRMSLWSGAEAWQLGGENLYRHKDAYYFLPSEDEWYKAAYHKNDGVSANYWDYATASNTLPTAVTGGTSPGTAVCDDLFVFPAEVTNAGGLSAYGTMGQNGNAREWIESAFDGANDSPTEARAVLGGYWESNESQLPSSQRGFGIPTQFLDDGEHFNGFRVASVPEPSATLLLLGAGLIALGKRRRSP
jgi:formylglycine-generating enzyme required for sulfatase activity